MKRERALSARWRSELEAIARSHGTTLDILRRPGRTLMRNVAPRVECFDYLAGQGWSSTEIGALFSRDHSTVLYWLDPDRRKQTMTRNAAYNRRRIALGVTR